ncbi:unnamed protein product [Rodentolepis nana]|uniref:Coiled-coil domain-containing protein 149 n=1 Tax=Rodentolepis nana TaxID=102285 RepID=A0A0R3T375_RODNA|nr:unnamed protein product [Rodentolepis nana]
MLSITKSQLQSKCQAISILKQQLEDTRKEADQFRVVSEQLHERYKNLRKALDTEINCPSTEGSQRKLIVNLKVKLNESEMQNRILEAELDHLRKRNSELVEDRLLKLSEQSPLRLCFGTESKHSDTEGRESLISQLEQKNIECKRLKRELELCIDEKQELLLGIVNNSDGECGSEKCRALYQENQMLTRQINRLEADRKLLTQSLAKYQYSSLISSPNVINDGPFESEPRDSQISMPS